jgi:gliding motility-associated-like protein
MGLTETVTLLVHPLLTYTVDTSFYNGYNISCYGLSDGYIRITPTVDLGPFTYSWTGPRNFTASTSEITGISAGQYTVTITDRNGCPVTQTFNMREPGELGMTFDLSVSNDGIYNINCHGAQTGTINVIPVNNVGAVSYRWYDGAAGNPRNDLGAGSYAVLITDANRCQATGIATLTEPPVLEAAYDITHAYCPEAPDAEIDLTVTGGSTASDYRYVWTGPNGFTATNEDLSGILPGVYTVTVTDFNDCSITVSMLVRPKNEICLKIPEAFSPNGDLINDTWDIDAYNENIELSDLYPDIVIKIFNRWGQKLWESDPGYPEPWDGRSNGVKLPIDSYHYTIDLGNESRLIIGNITIVYKSMEP